MSNSFLILDCCARNLALCLLEGCRWLVFDSVLGLLAVFKDVDKEVFKEVVKEVFKEASF